VLKELHSSAPAGCMDKSNHLWVFAFHLCRQLDIGQHSYSRVSSSVLFTEVSILNKTWVMIISIASWITNGKEVNNEEAMICKLRIMYVFDFPKCISDMM
jgi:hypothetical protein